MKRLMTACLCLTLQAWAPPSQAVAPAALGVAAHPLIGRTIGLDHVLLWAGDRDAAESVLSRQLGFQVGQPGSYGAGIQNQLIRFENKSFIEFLWLSDREEARKNADWAYDFVSKHNGSNAFGIQVESADAAYRMTLAAGLNPEQPGAEAYDPDGPSGPKPPMVNQWRFLFLGEGAAPGNPFFVEYRLSTKVVPAGRQHPNGALKLSSVWVLVRDLKAAQATYKKAGFTPGVAVSLPALSAKGLVMKAGDGDILLLTPSSAGLLKQRLAARGEHVVGLSVKVADIEATRRVLNDGFGKRLPLTHGRFGKSVISPTLDSLGLLMEFHE